MAKYCPECKKSCGTDICPTDKQGRCARCGKRPVEATDWKRRWVWCSQHDAWHASPCSADTAQHCCAPAA